MATIFLEGFDQYGEISNTANNPFLTITQALADGGWSVIGTGAVFTIQAGLSSQGYCLESANLTLTNTLYTSIGRIVGGFRFNFNITGANGFILYDNTTAQCSISVNATSGLISLIEGASGTTIATSSAAVTGGVTHYLEFDITIASAGAYKIYLDGALILNGTGDTKQSSNSSVNVIGLRTSSTGSNYFDDIYIFDTTGSYNNQCLLTSPIVYTQLPSADSVNQFTNEATIIGNIVGQGGVNYNANNTYVIPVTCSVNIAVTAINISTITAIYGGDLYIPVIYSDSGGKPHTLVASGSSTNGSSSSTISNFPLSVSYTLSANTPYWIGFLSNSNTQIFEDTLNGLSSASCPSTFTSGALSTFGTVTNNSYCPVIFASCSPPAHNFLDHDFNPSVQDLAYVDSATVGNYDLYDFPNLPPNITTVYSVSVVGNARLPLAGARTINLLTSSGGTISSGNVSGLSVTVTYTSYESNFDSNPNTGSSWTVSAINAALHGMQVAS